MLLRELFSQAVHFVNARVQSVKHAAESTVGSLYRDGSLVKRFTEGAKDMIAAIRHPEAMPAHQRHLNEFKMLVGGTASIAGAVELNPLFAGGGMIPAAEAALELEQAGHKWREKHNMRI